MNTPLTAILGILLILVHSVILQIFGVVMFTPEISVILVVYVMALRKLDSALATVIIIMIFSDLSVGGAPGHYALGLVVTALLVLWFRVLRGTPGVMGIFNLTMTGVIITHIVAMVSARLFLGVNAPFLLPLTMLISMMVITGVSVFPVYLLLSRLDKWAEARLHKASFA